MDGSFVEEIIDELIPVNNTPSADNEFSLTKQKTVYSNQQIGISYEIDAPVYESNCLPQGTCYDCVYELDLSFVDECGIDYVNKEFAEKKSILGEADNGSMCQPKNYKFDVELEQEVFDEGLFTLGKTLKVSSNAIEYYADLYMDQHSCNKTFTDFLYEELAGTDFSGCNIICCGDSALGKQQIIQGVDFEAIIQSSHVEHQIVRVMLV